MPTANGLFSALTFRNRILLIQLISAASFIVFLALLWLQHAQNKELNELETMVYKIEQSVLQLRRHEKDFMNRLDPKYIQRHQKEMERLNQIIVELTILLESHNMLSPTFRQIPSYLALYQDHFADFAALTLQKQMMLEELGLSWQKVMNNDLQNTSQKHQLLELKSQFDNFVFSKQRDYLNSFKVNAEQLEKNLPDSANKTLDDFIVLATAFSLLLEEIGLSHNEGMEGAMRNDVHKVEDFTNQLLLEIEPKLEQEILQNAINLLILLTALAIIIVSLVYSIGQEILKPIAALSSGINALRKGKRDVSFQQSNNELQSVFFALQKFQSDLSNLDRLRHQEQQTQRQLEKEKARLQQALQELNDMQDKLVQSEKLASLGSLVAGVSHEINTPLGNAVTIGSTMEIELNAFFDKLKSGKLTQSEFSDFEQLMEECLKVMLPSLDRAANLIHSFKQVAVDQTSEVQREFNLAQMVGDLVLTLKHQLKQSNIQCDVSIDNSIKLNSYPGPLGQAITNLFNNAVIHGFNNSDDGQINITAEKKGHLIELVIEDNGCGVSIENQEKVFDPFFTTKLGQGGSGLGLNITYNIIVGLLGGEIQLDSDGESGSRFICLIPL